MSVAQKRAVAGSLGLIGQMPACTDSSSKPWVQAAGVRFENFSDDFVTWVVFYGPPGGE